MVLWTDTACIVGSVLGHLGVYIFALVCLLGYLLIARGTDRDAGQRGNVSDSGDFDSARGVHDCAGTGAGGTDGRVRPTLALMLFVIIVLIAINAGSQLAAGQSGDSPRWDRRRCCWRIWREWCVDFAADYVMRTAEDIRLGNLPR